MEGRAQRTNERPTLRHRYISSTQRAQSGSLAENPEEGFTCGGSRGRYAGYTDIRAGDRLVYKLDILRLLRRRSVAAIFRRLLGLILDLYGIYTCLPEGVRR